MNTEEQAVPAGRNMRFEGQHRAEAAEDAAARLAMVRDLDTLREVVGLAYAHLWTVNNEPDSDRSGLLRSAAHEARKLLRDTMTQEQRKNFIQRVIDAKA